MDNLKCEMNPRVTADIEHTTPSLLERLLQSVVVFVVQRLGFSEADSRRIA